MKRFAEPLRCPDCDSELSVGAVRCDACGLSLRGPVASRLFATLVEADRLMAQLREESAAETTPVPAASAEAAPVVPGLAPPPPTDLQTPSSPGTRRSSARLSGATVPKILLTLGAICLLAAALVFLAVNWARLGVGGRTAFLILFTLVTGTIATWSAGRRLRAGLESLGLVTYGLITLDVFGAVAADWFGDLSFSETFLLFGSVLVVTGLGGGFLAQSRTAMHFRSSEVVAALGGAAALAGIAFVDWWDVEYSLAVALIVLLGFVQAARASQLRAATVGLSLVSLASWLALLGRGVDLADQHPSWHGLWVETEGWPLLLAAAVPWFAQAGPHVSVLARRVLVGLGGVALLALLMAPSSDERPETWLLTGLALTAASAVVTRAITDPVGPGWALPTGLATLGVGSLAGGYATVGLGRVGEAAAEQWRGVFTGHVDPLTVSSDLPSPVFAGLVALTALFTVQALVDRLSDWNVELLSSRFGVGVVALMSWFGIITLDIPVWTWVTAGLVLAVVAVADRLVTHALTPLVWAVVVMVPTLVASFFASGLTLLSLSVIAVGAATVAYRSSGSLVPGAAGAVGMVASGAWIWTYGDLQNDVVRWTAFVALGSVALLALLHAVFAQRGSLPASLLIGVEAGSLLVVPPLIPAGLSGTTPDSSQFWLAAYLTVIGAGVCLVGLAYSPHRLLLWPGAFVLAVASWVRLDDLGVETPEAYTLPWALLLLAVGGFHVVRRNAASLAMLGPGLGLALVPSLLWSLDDPISVRTAILGAGCLVLVLAGAWARWAGPLLYGAGAGAVLVVRLASPYIAEAVPRWVIIGVAGTILVAVGLTWERRLAEARRTVTYLRGLR